MKAVKTTHDSSRGMREILTLVEGMIATATLIAICVHLMLRFGLASWSANWPLVAMVVVGGAPLTFDVIKGAIKASGGADLLAAMSIIAAVAMGEWLVVAIIVLMLSVGEALEEAASRSRPHGGRGHQIHITNRVSYVKADPTSMALLSPSATGMESVVLIDGHYAATLITEVHGGMSLGGEAGYGSGKTKTGSTLFLGDGISDAPAMPVASASATACGASPCKASSAAWGCPFWA